MRDFCQLLKCPFWIYIWEPGESYYVVPCFQWTHCEIVLYRSSLLASLGNPALFCVCVRESRFSHVQLFVTPWSLASQVPVSMEVSRQEYWSGLPFPSSGDLPEGIEPSFPALAGGFFTNKLPGKPFFIVQFSSVAQSCMTLCNPWTAACQASLSITNTQSLLKLMSIESAMPSIHLSLCGTLLLPASGSFPMRQFFASGGQSIWA